MPVSTTKVQITGMAGSDVAALATQFNNLVDILAAWGAGFDGDSGVAATNHVSTLEAAVSKIANASGTEQ
jgi:hypothetical protein